MEKFLEAVARLADLPEPVTALVNGIIEED